eukprot:g2798.t1
MSVSIKVAMRCRPYSIDDKLGVQMVQNGEEEGEVNLLNSDYTTNRFAFTYAWWSAYGFDRHIQSNHDEAEAMTLMNQEMVYNSVGKKIKADLYEGNAVVLFAYGLSGSGKTFTVFGPDAVDIPEAWFKHAEPHPLWGIFPRLAYEMFKDKTDGWKITMKYFQNVVDTVRDLMSPVISEQHYKNGMKKDENGFMDIDWCCNKVLNDWDELRTVFMQANAKKAIAPTQFNHQSTRGHCIMTLEVEMPHPDMAGMKQKGRVYVCDLAGTEPAGDIVFAKYEKKVFPNGDIEHKYIGAHEDDRKTKELQNQGMKINLSLTEMAQFFMKMADAVKKKKLKPGASIPGCNSYFLCKFLKDTMLQARTYLFCAIRPEVKYHPYTFSTCNFAKNASVVKLQPKKAVAASSPAERKLMEELEQMKMMMDAMKAENEKLAAAGKGGEGDSKLQEMLAAKQAELMNVLASREGEEGGTGGAGGGGGANDAEERMMQQQREEYGRRGIHLTYFEKGTRTPHFINLDEDPFRSHRFMYLLDKPRTTFGSGGDIKPLSLTVAKNHCVVVKEGGEAAAATEPPPAGEEGPGKGEGGSASPPATYFLECGDGETFINGRLMSTSEKVAMSCYDRVAIGGELLLFDHPGARPLGEGAGEGEGPSPVAPPTAEFAVEELQAALRNKGKQAQEMLDERMKQFEEEKVKWEQQRQAAAQAGKAFDDAEPTMDEERERAWQSVDKEILDVLPKIKEAKNIVGLMDRDTLTFDVALQRTEDEVGVPKVKVRVENSDLVGEANSILLDPIDFLRGFSVLKDELVHLRNAKENGRTYVVDTHHDPIQLLFDNTFHLGTGVMFPEFMLYNLEMESDERVVDIKNVSAPYNNVGAFEMVWTPLPGPEEEDAGKDLMDVETEDDLLGKPWTYRVDLKGATGLPLMVSHAFVQYELGGQLFTTETVEQDTHNPVLEYSFVHHVERVSAELIASLKKPMQFRLWVSPYVINPKNLVSTDNPRVLNPNAAGTPLLRSGTTVGPDSLLRQGTVSASLTDGSIDPDKISVSQEYLHGLRVALETERRRVEELEAEVCRLNRELAVYRTPTPRSTDENGDAPRKSSQPCSPKKRLESAVETDRVLTNALKDTDRGGGAAGAAGGAADGGGGGGAPAPAGDAPAGP